MRIVFHIVVNAIALAVADALIAGISVGQATMSQRVLTLLAVAVVFGLVNALIKPIVKVLTFPAYILTLGLFTFVVNAVMLLLTAWISDRLDLLFRVDGFIAALLGALVISIVSFLLNIVLPDKYET